MEETLLNAMQVRRSGDISSQTLMNLNQIRSEGDSSLQTLLNPNQILGFIPPSDWSDIRKDCPAESIALYAAHSSDYATAGYQQIGTVPYTLVGSPTITNGVMSGFTSEGYDGADNYAFIDAYPTETIKSFRIKIKFTVGTLPSSSQYYTLVGQKEGNYNCPQIDITTGLLSYRHPIGTGWANYNVYTSVSANTTYWAIIDWTSYGSIKMFKSTDGVQYTLASSSSGNQTITWNKAMALGADFDTALNEMSKSFGGGGSIDLNETSIEINNKVWFKYGGKITAVNNNNLYLQSSGTQYIDTGVIVSNDIGFDCDYETADDIATTNYGAIFGTRISSSSSNFQITSYSSDGSFLGSFRFGDNANSKSVGMIKNTRQQVSFRNLAFTNASGTTSNVNTYSWANGNPILLYAFNDNGTAVGGKATAKIHRQKFYYGDTLIRDFVPVKQGMIIGNFTVPANGMWDLVNQEYYPNFGTGDFTYGGEDTQYDNLGFTATCLGGYNVYIDGEQYGTTYESGATCSITWSNYMATTGESITTPSALTAHKIWVEPATSGTNITHFKMTDRTGLLWLHSNVTTVFTSTANFVGGTTGSSLIKAVTAKNNVLKSKNMSTAFGKCPYLEYVPILDFDNSDVAIPYLFYSPLSYNLKKVIIRNLKQTGTKGNSQAFVGCYGLEEIVLQNSDLCWYVTLFYKYLYSLKKLPKGLYNDTGNVYATDFSSLEPTNLDFRERTAAKYITINGDSTHFAGGIKSLRVSNQAPFDYATPPQINVSYTGMDRQALVQLFNDLPYNVGYTLVGSPTINNGVMSGFATERIDGVNNYAVINSYPETVNSFRIKVKFTLNELPEAGRFYTIFGQSENANMHSPQLAVQEGQLVYSHPLGTSWGNFIAYNVSANTTYWAIIEWNSFNGNTSMLVSTDGISYTNAGTVSNASIVWNTSIGIGMDWSATYNMPSSTFTGSIDLNETYMKVNDVYWFRGQPAMTKTLSCVGATGNQNKLSFVGNLTINNDIVSSFENNASYFKTVNNFNTSGKSWTIIMKAKTGNSAEDMSVNNALVGEDTNYSFVAGFLNTNMKYWLSSDGATWTTNGGIGSITLSNNTDYWFKFDYDYATHTFKSYVSTDKQNWELDYTNTDGVVAITSILNFGVSRTKVMQLSGNIDLSSIELYIDNTLQFTREQYLSPEDKDIALNKNWALTLS